jgi:RNA polymerase sigma-70 factor (ECF subfamily)
MHEAAKYDYENKLKILFEKYFDKLTIYAYSILHQQEVAEEVVSDVFMNIWEKKESLLKEENLQAYLFKAAHNKCIDYLRSQKTIKNQKTITLYSVLENEILVDPHFVLEEIFSKNLEEAILKAIEKLPEKRKEIFLLNRIENLSYQQIAEKLSLSINSVKTQISRSVEFLRKEIQRISIFTFF